MTILCSEVPSKIDCLGFHRKENIELGIPERNAALGIPECQLNFPLPLDISLGDLTP